MRVSNGIPALDLPANRESISALTQGVNLAAVVLPFAGGVAAGLLF